MPEVRSVRFWSINGRFLTQRVTGVQRYAREIVGALDDALASDHPLARDLAVDLVVPDAPFDAMPLKRIRTVARGRWGGHIWEQAMLPGCVKGGLLCLGNAGPLTVRRQIICMHDVNTRTFPSSYSAGFRAQQRLALPILGRTAAAVATVSQYSAGELVRHGICDKNKIVVIPNGHEHVKRWGLRLSPAIRRVASRSTVVMIGTPAPHKNFGLLLGLAPRLHAAGLRIAIVGAAEPKVYGAARIGTTAEAVTCLGKLSDGELAALLGDCLCLAFPSFVEGFGLPPLEAMALGCPVVVSDRASLPELCGSSALYCSPMDPDAWFDCFLRLRDNDGLRRQMALAGQERALAFSWSRSAELYLQVMSAVDRSWARHPAARRPSRLNAT